MMLPKCPQSENSSDRSTNSATRGEVAKNCSYGRRYPCTGGCSWQRTNEAINPEKVQRHRDQYLTLFKSLKQVLRLTKRHKPALAIELPKSCQYWQYAVVQCLIKEHQLVDTFCNGCMLGVTDQHGIRIRKSGRIACTFPIVALQDKICDGNHMHGESRGQALKIAESYTFSMTDAIHREFARHVNSRTTKALPVTYLPACCRVARSDPWTISVNYHLVDPHKDQAQPSTSKMASASSASVTGKSGLMLDDVQERADYWKKLLWEATLSTDSKLVEDRHEVVSFRNMLNALYDGVPPQTAASSALAGTSYRHLQRLAEVSDESLRMLQPELRRGQQRVPLIVSDSTIVFCKGRKGSIIS